MNEPDRISKARMSAMVGIALLTCAAAVGGCSGTNDDYVTTQRLGQGLMVILPGIEGEGLLCHRVRRGLLIAGVDMALPIYRWGRPIPLAGPLLNQMDVSGNRLAGRKIAQMIVTYQDAHPGRPVYIIGHSGGGGVAVFAAEAMPEGRTVDGLVLLSASISSGYDLSKALSRCKKGIVNFYSKGDIGLLVIGTTLLGNVDGVRGPAAGAVGFGGKFPGLHEVAWRPEMARTGNLGGHAGTCESRFIKAYVAPWLGPARWGRRVSSLSSNP